MTYSAIDVARYTVNYCANQNYPINNLKLQKILYFMWIDYYKATGNTLFVDDICAWRSGPVIPRVYYEYCAYAGRPIPNGVEENIKQEDKDVLNLILQKYFGAATNVLINRALKKGGSWDVIYRDGLGNKSVIPFSLIIELECM